MWEFGCISGKTFTVTDDDIKEAYEALFPASAELRALRAENAELREKVKVADGLKRIVDEENLVLCKNNGNQSTSLGSLLAETEKQEKELRTLRAAIDAAKEKE